MKLKSSIVTIVALSSMSFAGGDIGGVVDLGNKYNDYVPAVTEVETEYVAPIQYPTPQVEEYLPPVDYVTPVPIPTATPTPYIAPPTPVPTTPPVVVVPTPKPTPKKKVVSKPSGPSGFYVGGALTQMASRSDCKGNRANLFSSEKGQDRQLGFTGILGYDFMDYLGAELRTSIGMAGEEDTKMKQYGLYLKPNIDINKALNLYALLGYSSVNMSDCGSNADLDNDNDGFSYGAGLDYGVTENISVFTDIVNYLRDDKTRSTWGANLGVKYKF